MLMVYRFLSCQNNCVTVHAHAANADLASYRRGYNFIFDVQVLDHAGPNLVVEDTACAQRSVMDVAHTVQVRYSFCNRTNWSSSLLY